MAGDWIKVEKATARKPEILRLSTILNISPDQAFGLCVRFWFWCDDHLVDCHAPGVTNVTLDSVVGHAGFADGLLEVGWLQVRNGSLVIPNFDRHLSESAKKRALSAERKRKERVTEMSRSKRDKNATREEKRREEVLGGKPPNNPGGEIEVASLSLPPILDTQAFRDALASWLAYKHERRERYKPTGFTSMITLAANRAEKYGVEAVIDAMRRAMGNNWAGWDQPSLFDKGATNGKPNPIGPGQRYDPSRPVEW